MARYDEYLESARVFAELGANHTLRYFRRSIDVERKADASPVTIADRETEATIRRAIIDRYPDHAVVGEEYGGSLGTNEWEWIIDPIDGTKSFIRGVPLYTTLVALVHRGRPVVGVIAAPAADELVYAAVGTGSFDRDGTRLAVSSCTDVASAWFGATDPRDLAERRPRFHDEISRSVGAIRTWADAYGYLLVARGAIDVMVDPILSPWDIAPLSVVIREAGGVFTTFAGDSDDLGDSAIAAATPELHQAIVELAKLD